MELPSLPPPTVSTFSIAKPTTTVETTAPMALTPPVSPADGQLNSQVQQANDCKAPDLEVPGASHKHDEAESSNRHNDLTPQAPISIKSEEFETEDYDLPTLATEMTPVKTESVTEVSAAPAMVQNGLFHVPKAEVDMNSDVDSDLSSLPMSDIPYPPDSEEEEVLEPVPPLPLPEGFFDEDAALQDWLGTFSVFDSGVRDHLLIGRFPDYEDNNLRLEEEMEPLKAQLAVLERKYQGNKNGRSRWKGISNRRVFTM